MFCLELFKHPYALHHPVVIAVAIWGIASGVIASFVGHRYVERFDDEGYEYASYEPMICGSCGEEISLKGAFTFRCDRCHTPRSSFVLEALGNLLVCIAMLAILGVSVPLIAYLWLIPTLTTITITDFRTMLIPTKIVWGSMAVGIIIIVASSLVMSAPGAIVGAAIGSLGCFGVFFLMTLIKSGGLGFGDVRLVTMLGLYLGWLSPVLPLWGITFGSIFYLLYAVPTRIIKVKETGSFSPFGPGLALGAVVAISQYAAIFHP